MVSGYLQTYWQKSSFSGVTTAQLHNALVEIYQYWDVYGLNNYFTVCRKAVYPTYPVVDTVFMLWVFAGIFKLQLVGLWK